MIQRTLKSLAGLLLFFVITVFSTQAPAYYPPYGYQPQPQGYPQPYPDNRQPSPYWYPYQQQAPQAPRFEPPRVEALLSDLTPYEQQSLVYRVRINSGGNLKTAVPTITESKSLVMRKLGDAVTFSDPEDDARIITEYRYLLMPLSSGVIEVPPVRVSGQFSAAGGQEGPNFNVSGKSLTMHVRPSTGAVQPWLPLYDLKISARIRGDEAPAAGNPIELVVETRAVGATGSQIPSVAGSFTSDDFRIYPGKISTEGKVSSDGKTLHGRRVENFTLVPRYGGWLQLPNVTLNWWNVRYNRPEVAALLTDQINVMGPSNPGRGGADNGSSLISAFYWLPLVIAVGILLFGWLTAFLGDGRLPGTESIKNLFRPILGELYAPLAELTNRFSPRRSFHRLRAWTGRQLPISWKLWFCLRAVSREDDPAEWATALQILAAKHLGVRPQAHLRQLGKSIVSSHPRANAARVDRLLLELDQAVYGGKPMRSFSRWKRDFKNQIKPGLFNIRWRQRSNGSPASEELPELNPR